MTIQVLWHSKGFAAKQRFCQKMWHEIQKLLPEIKLKRYYVRRNDDERGLIK